MQRLGPQVTTSKLEVLLPTSPVSDIGERRATDTLRAKAAKTNAANPADTDNTVTSPRFTLALVREKRNISSPDNHALAFRALVSPHGILAR